MKVQIKKGQLDPIGVALLVVAGVSLVGVVAAGILWGPDKPSTPVIVAQAALPQPLVQERVIVLPEDGERWYTVMVYSNKGKPDSADRQLAAAMATTPRLQSLAAQTKVVVWDDSDVLFNYKFRTYFGESRPVICVQDQHGKVAYKATGANIPADGEMLATEIADGIARICPRPKPPQPQPEPEPAPAPDPVVVPDIRPEPETPKTNALWYLLPFLAGGLGAYRAYRR
jgi:hypothetical protein